jgi:hypothetical protein
MRPTALAPLAPAALGLPAAVLDILPAWAQLALTGISVLLAATQVIVAQIIRLRASARITRSQDALRVLEMQDTRPRGQPA